MGVIKSIYDLVKYIVTKHESNAQDDFDDFEKVWNDIFNP